MRRNMPGDKPQRKFHHRHVGALACALAAMLPSPALADDQPTQTRRAADEAAARAAPTPPMGWNPWNAFRTEIDEDKILRNAEALVKLGFANSGYRYVVMDDGWWLRRGADGRIQIRTTMFPSADIGGGRTSFRPYINRLHSMGLKAGIYTDIGHNACSQAWDPDSPNLPTGTQREREIGTMGFQAQDAKLLFGEWGFDYVKVDACGLADFKPTSDNVKNGHFRAFDPWILRGKPAQSKGKEVEALYRSFAEAIAAAKPNNRPILSICAWGEADVSDWANRYGNLWRTSADIGATWKSMLHSFDTTEPRALFAGPGRWNDPDMLQIGNGEFNADHVTEARAHMSIWAIMAAPLMISTDLTHTPRPILDILGNRQVIAINQDALGNQGVTLHRTPTTQIVVKTLSGRGNKAAALINRSDAPASVTLDMADLHLAPATEAIDVWSGQKLAVRNGKVTVSLRGRETALLRIQGTPADPQTLYVQEMPARVQVATLGYLPADRGPKKPWIAARIGQVPGGAPVQARRLGIGQFPGGAPLQVSAKDDHTAIGVAPGSRLSISLRREFRRFRAVPVGADGSNFKLYADGKPLPIRTTAQGPIDVNVTGVKQLDLVAPTPVGTGQGYAWAQARFTR